MTVHLTALASPDPQRPASAPPAPSADVADMLEDLGRKLANQRARRRMSRAELADRIDCSPDAVLSAEIGEQPSSRNFWALADVVLRADGRLLAAADRISQRQAAAHQESPSPQPHPAHEAVDLAHHRPVQKHTTPLPTGSAAQPPPAATCPAWCHAFHVDPETEDHIRLVDAVHRMPHLASVAVELEQVAADTNPFIVLSLFTQEKRPKAMSAGLAIDQARHAHAALGEALRLAASP